MTILITGGTGKTGLLLARLLHNANFHVLLASRSGVAPTPFTAVKFDWFNLASHINPFDADPQIDRVYLISPPSLEQSSYVKPFIDLAISKGVKRIVLLTSTLVEPGMPGPGLVHEYILKTGVDSAVLRPTWFMENFETRFLTTIRDENMIPSTVGDGKIPFVAVADIANAAFETLTAEPSPNTFYYLLGPEYLSYDQAAQIFTEVLGRKITHRRVSLEEGEAFWKSAGLPQEMANYLVKAEQFCSSGAEAKLADSPNAKIGRCHLREYVEAHKDVWSTKHSS